MPLNVKLLLCGLVGLVAKLRFAARLCILGHVPAKAVSIIYLRSKYLRAHMLLFWRVDFVDTPQAVEKGHRKVVFFWYDGRK